MWISTVNRERKYTASTKEQKKRNANTHNPGKYRGVLQATQTTTDVGDPEKWLKTKCLNIVNAVSLQKNCAARLFDKPIKKGL